MEAQKQIYPPLSGEQEMGEVQLRLLENRTTPKAHSEAL